MNQRGHILLIIFAAFIVIALIPILLSNIFWQFRLLAQIIMIFMIYSMVRGFMGAGYITIVISAILVYFMVFKYFDIVLGLYVFQFLLGLQFMSVVIWGLGTRLRGY